MRCKDTSAFHPLLSEFLFTLSVLLLNKKVVVLLGRAALQYFCPASHSDTLSLEKESDAKIIKGYRIFLQYDTLYCWCHFEDGVVFFTIG